MRHPPTPRRRRASPSAAPPLRPHPASLPPGGAGAPRPAPHPRPRVGGAGPPGHANPTQPPPVGGVGESPGGLQGPQWRPAPREVVVADVACRRTAVRRASGRVGGSRFRCRPARGREGQPTPGGGRGGARVPVGSFRPPPPSPPRPPTPGTPPPGPAQALTAAARPQAPEGSPRGGSGQGARSRRRSRWPHQPPTPHPLLNLNHVRYNMSEYANMFDHKALPPRFKKVREPATPSL